MHFESCSHVAQAEYKLCFGQLFSSNVKGYLEVSHFGVIWNAEKVQFISDIEHRKDHLMSADAFHKNWAQLVGRVRLRSTVLGQRYMPRFCVVR